MNRAREARFAFFSALITAIALLLAVAVSAQAEPISDAAAATTAAASDVVILAEEQAQTIPAEPVPASTEPIEKVAASTVEAVPVKESATALESSGATIESDRGVSSPGAVADSTETATPRSVPSTSEVGAMAAQASKATVAATADNVSKLAGDVTRDSAEAAAPLVDRVVPLALADVPVRPALAQLVHGVLGADGLRGLSQIVAAVAAPLHGLLDGGSPAQVVPPSEQIPRVGTRPSLGVSPMSGNLRPPVNWPLGGVLSREQAGAGELRAGYLPTFVDARLAKLTAPGELDLADARAMPVSGRGFALGERPDGRAPLDPPVPLPGSSGAANGAPGSIFVPFAALFALLALVAPAARRRLEEASAFRPLTPFVCGLERPG